MQYEENKSYCEDLTEGKFSFPIIHAIRNHPDDKTLISKCEYKLFVQTNSINFLDIIKQRTHNVELKRYAVNRLEAFGSFEYTMTTMNDLSDKAIKEVELLGGNPYLNQLLEYLKEI